jgi:hypothetical protein
VSDFSAAFEELLAALNRLEIPFLIGGSVASGIHGILRQTKDIDIVADMAPAIVEEFCEVLASSFYADAEQAALAIRDGRAFNVIHLKSAYKFDIFPAGKDRFVQSQLARRRYATTSIAGLENIEFPVASAEDTILAKLVWFRKGGEVSDQQWHDVLGMMRVQAGRLDLDYLGKWAKELGVSDLLGNALDS